MHIFSWKDPLSWPEFLGREPVFDRNIDEDLVDQFYEQFTHVRVYHASRPIDPQSIKRDGLKRARYEDLLTQFRSNLACYCGILLEDEQINDAKEELGSFHDGSLFVVINDDDLLSHAGHYAIYGSEYIVGIVNRIHQRYGTCHLEDLAKFGTSTVYVIDLPLELLSEDDVSCLVREINNYVYEGEIAQHVDFTFELRQPIPGDFIVDYYHPKRIADPLRRHL